MKSKHVSFLGLVVAAVLMAQTGVWAQTPPSDTAAPAAGDKAPAGDKADAGDKAARVPALMPASREDAAPAPAVTEDSAAAETPEQPTAESKDKESKDESASREAPTDFVAPTLDGGAGLFRVWSAYPGRTFDIRVGIHFEYFRQKRFIVDNWSNCGSACPNEVNTRVQGAVTLGFTPWKYMEVFAALYSSSNRNERHHQPLGPGELNPNETPLQMALGDTLIGVMGAYPVTPYLSLGLKFGVKFLTSQGDTKPDFGATNLDVAALLSTDFRKIHSKVPLTAHLNVGFVYDRSNDLVDADIYKDPDASSEYHHYYLVQQFALGLNRSRVHIGLGFNVTLPYLASVLKDSAWLRYFPEVIAEVGMDVGVGSPDSDIKEWGEFDDGKSHNVDGRVATRLSTGLRFKPVDGLLLDVGVDVALSQYGFAVGPALPPWNLFFQAGYAFAPGGHAAPKTIVKVKEITKYIVRKPKVTKGTVHGMVKDAKTSAPLAQAIVTFVGKGVSDVATAEDGSFTSFAFEAGKVTIEVRRAGYKPASAEAVVKAGESVNLEVALEPEPPKVGKVLGTLAANDGKSLAGSVEFTGPETKKVDVSDGAFQVELKPGTYKVKATAAKHFTRVAQVVVEAGQKALLELKLTPRPKRMLVVVTRRKLRIRKKVHFATGKAELTEDGRQLLDQVAAVLNEHPEIALVRIEGHTDNRGSKSFNMRLSQNRADSVRDYLISQGVDADRLIAKGYGPTRPLVPNFSRRNRRRNRRVEFRILKRK